MRFAALLVSAALFAMSIPSGRRVSALDGDGEMPFPALAAMFRRHCVQVYISGRSSDGEAPPVGEFADDIANERPTLCGGYWWDGEHVLIDDSGLADRFIRSIEIAVPGGDARWNASVAARFVRLQAALLRVEPDGDGAMPPADPLSFGDGLIEDGHVIASYDWDGEWMVDIGASLGTGRWNDRHAEFVGNEGSGIILSGSGRPLGIAFGPELEVSGRDSYWRGRRVKRSPLVWADDYDAKQGVIGEALARAVLQATIRFRVDIDDDGDGDWRNPLAGDGIDESASEIRLAGFVTGARHVFIPAPLGAAHIARIEEVAVTLPDGRDVPARFAGALRDYMAIVVETGSDLPADPPPGFALLNPLIVPDEAFMPDSDFDWMGRKGLFLRLRIDYELGRRRETADTDRWLGVFRGYRGAPVVATQTNEESGSLAFDMDGRLIAVALAPRVPPSESPGGKRQGGPGFRPLRHVYDATHDSDAVDPALVPAAREAGRRLVDLGVEWQTLDANTSRLFNVEKATRAGRIGVLVSHVYPGTPAAEIDLREQDVLLRLFIPGQAEPIELSPTNDHMTGMSLMDVEDMSVEATQRLMASLPPPWPSRENTLSSLLTSVGVGREVRLDYLREGEPMTAAFVTRYTPADYRNAPRAVAAELGMTVRPVTYEVRRFFRRGDSSGVIVSRVEEGGRSSVAGLYPYLLITGIDGAPVLGFRDFKDRIESFEEGEAASIELMVEGFGKTRLVKIER